MISSTSNPRVKNIIHLMNSPKSRKEQDCFLAEGPRMVFEVPPAECVELYVTESFLAGHQEELGRYRYEVVTDAVMNKMSDTKTPQGILALVKRHTFTLEELLQEEENPVFMILETIQDPGNLGTILRTAEGAGVTGLILNTSCVDPFHPKVIRSTMGAIFRMPIVICEELSAVTELLKARGIDVYAAHLAGSSFYDADYTRGCAFLIGNEGNGLTEQLAMTASRKIRIPMKGKVESLNAAIAATVLMYEVQRQRKWE